MRNLGIFQPEKLIGFLTFVGLPAAVFYFICMFVFPWVDGNFVWSHVQNVWDRWQSLNVAMLAFVSSITAFNISKFNAEKQREREFLASKAFLPAALSELVSYFKASAALLEAGWESEPGNRPAFLAPVLPQEFKEVFASCIRHAEPSVGDYLSLILVRLQVHDARLRGYIDQRGDNDQFNPDKYNLITYFYRLGELQALVGKLFEFARNNGDFDSTPLDWETFRNAYGNLDIEIDNIRIDDNMNLEAFTKRAISRHANQSPRS